jgi:hypothetical protein
MNNTDFDYTVSESLFLDVHTLASDSETDIPKGERRCRIAMKGLPQ